MANDAENEDGYGGRSEILEEVLSDITDEYLPALRQGLVAQASKEEEPIIDPLFDALEEQLREVTGRLREENQGLAPGQVQEIDQFLRSSAAPQLLSAGVNIAGDMSTRQAKTAQGDVFDLLKKLIRKVPELFGGSLPSWFSDLLELINELKNQLLSLGSPQLSHEFSRRHQDYLGELAQLERLKHAQEKRRDSSDDNSNGG